MNTRCFTTLLLLTMIPGAAHTHEIGLSRGVYTPTEDGLLGEIVLAAGELLALDPSLDVDGDGQLSTVELEAAAPRLTGYVPNGLKVIAGGESCAGEAMTVRPTEKDGVALSARWRCAEANRTQVQFTLLAALSPGHRHIARVAEIDHVLRRGAESFNLAPGAPAREPSFFGWIGLGVEHILIGFDHLVFLLALVLVVAHWRSLLTIVTAFTVAHSVTLAIAALGVWVPPGEVIEPLIALSVAYVGVENFFVREPTHRWRLALPFGLVHGFGFAGVLADIGLPTGQHWLPLLGFNLGVELGQLAVLALVVPALAWARRRPDFVRLGVPAMSGLIVAVGGLWFVERVF